MMFELSNEHSGSGSTVTYIYHEETPMAVLQAQPSHSRSSNDNYLATGVFVDTCIHPPGRPSTQAVMMRICKHSLGMRAVRAGSAQGIPRPFSSALGHSLLRLHYNDSPAAARSPLARQSPHDIVQQCEPWPVYAVAFGPVPSPHCTSPLRQVPRQMLAGCNGGALVSAMLAAMASHCACSGSQLLWRWQVCLSLQCVTKPKD